MNIAEKYDNMRRMVKYPASVDLDREVKRKLIEDYNKKMNEIDFEFKMALFSHCKLPINGNTLPTLYSKANKAFSIAWEHGHSSGYNEVEMYFLELVELIK